MSPRPRQASDEQMLMAAFRAIARIGPARVTLADVASEAGVTPAALVQRFGSKRALLLAASADAASGHRYLFVGLRARHRSPLAALLGLGGAMEVMGDTPDRVARSQAFLQMEVTDPAFRANARAGSRTFHRELTALVRDAIAAGELVRCDASRLARVLQAALHGSILDWTIQRRGSMATWVRRDLKTVIDGYRTSKSD